MRFIRFIFPFLFVRNWYDGAWEFSKVRFAIFLTFLLLLSIALGIVHVLYLPVEYSG